MNKKDYVPLNIDRWRFNCAWLCRARELFYYLKGGQVDYGEEHSKACGHSRFGRIYHTGRDPEEHNTWPWPFRNFFFHWFLHGCSNFGAGHYPVWDEHNPVHFVGHSAGAQVARVLHQMLADKVHKQEFFSFTHKW
jgi:hypothetical protein